MIEYLKLWLAKAAADFLIVGAIFAFCAICLAVSALRGRRLKS